MCDSGIDKHIDYSFGTIHVHSSFAGSIDLCEQ
jgi:hypothetical protein